MVADISEDIWTVEQTFDPNFRFSVNSETETIFFRYQRVAALNFISHF